MINSMRCPQYFVVGAGAIAEAGYHAAHFGRRALIIGGNRAIDSVRAGLLASLDAAAVTYHVERGEHVAKTLQSVNALTAIGREQKAEVLIGCGGGAVMDCGKAVAHDLGIPYVAVPTTAGVNASGTASAGIEGDTGPRRRWYQAADVVIADTAVIAAAGGRLLASGIGDSLPANYAVSLAVAHGDPTVTLTRIALAGAIKQTLFADGPRAYRACERGQATPEVDRVVEAGIFLSGMVPYGMGGDHALHPAAMPQCRRRAIHGEWVAFGLLTRLVLGGEFNEDIPLLLDLYREVNLPARFADFGLDDPSRDDLLAECRRIVGPQNAADYGTGRPTTAEEVLEAWLEVDSLGRRQ
ncbi:MAG: iron-containing alcohol dehydrogenase [Anaerolineae bacterium]